MTKPFTKVSGHRDTPSSTEQFDRQQRARSSYDSRPDRFSAPLKPQSRAEAGGYLDGPYKVPRKK
jgi:hypothetical protein